MSETPVLNKETSYKQAIEERPKTNLLNASHRCDHSNCSAAAYVKVNLLAGEKNPEGGFLLFCSHHFNRNELALMPFMDGQPIDERHKLEQNKLVGTENS